MTKTANIIIWWIIGVILVGSFLNSFFLIYKGYLAPENPGN